MSAISNISSDNINLSPSSFSFNGIRSAGKGLQIETGKGFGDELNLKVNGLKASVSEPLGKTGTGNAVKDLVMAVNQKEMMADSMRAAVLSGESNNLHQTMIASQEANVAFTLMLEMRNKVMETYQELMRMQI